mmetsp:Transcript_18930/g.40252  ORF Transcript_18930/g.40252 Transcript_18930/m.40252 type:complete len:206 (-) Transcript_18930:1225-1842(-)
MVARDCGRPIDRADPRRPRRRGPAPAPGPSGVPFGTPVRRSHRPGISIVETARRCHHSEECGMGSRIARAGVGPARHSRRPGPRHTSRSGRASTPAAGHHASGCDAPCASYEPRHPGAAGQVPRTLRGPDDGASALPLVDPSPPLPAVPRRGRGRPALAAACPPGQCAGHEARDSPAPWRSDSRSHLPAEADRTSPASAPPRLPH